MEGAYHCGSNGYPVGYGNKYCSRFLERYDKFSPAGKKWIDQTLVCLKNALKDSLLNNDKESCTNLKTIAYDSHPKCYVDSGFCKLFT